MTPARASTTCIASGCTVTVWTTVTRPGRGKPSNTPYQISQSKLNSQRANEWNLRYLPFRCDSVNDLFCFIE